MGKGLFQCSWRNVGILHRLDRPSLGVALVRICVSKLDEDLTVRRLPRRTRAWNSQSFCHYVTICKHPVAYRTTSHPLPTFCLNMLSHVCVWHVKAMHSGAMPLAISSRRSNGIIASWVVNSITAFDHIRPRKGEGMTCMFWEPRRLEELAVFPTQAKSQTASACHRRPGLTQQIVCCLYSFCR